MAIGPFLARLQQFAEVKGFDFNRVSDLINSITDYSGTFSLTPTNGHLVIVNSVPTLGALQSGVATQSIVGTDSCHIVTITTTALSPPAASAQIFHVNFANAFTAVPAVLITENGTGVVWAATATNTASGYNAFHGGTAAGSVALSGSTTYNYACLAIGAGAL